MASLAGKSRYDRVDTDTFIPDYFGERKTPVDNDPMQRSVYASLKAKLAEVQGPTSSEPGNPNPPS